jgi:hypothetical protein
MTLEEKLKYCIICENRSMNRDIGMVCGLTKKKPNFITECNKFIKDEVETQRKLELELSAAGDADTSPDSSPQRNVNIGILILTLGILATLSGYIITYGAIIAGILMIIKGVRQKRIMKEHQEFHANTSSNNTETSYGTIFLEKSSEMMNEIRYWGLISFSIQNSTNQDTQEDFLIKELEKLSPKDIVGFRLRTDKLLYDTYTSEMWCAGYIMNGGCSDDSFEYFRLWIISKGKEVYDKAKAKPDNLVYEIIEGEEYYEFESFWYVGLEAFKNKTGKELYDYIADNFKTNEGNYIQFELNWSDEKPETMKAICPNLFNKMWH